MLLHYTFDDASGTMSDESGWTHEIANASVSANTKMGVMWKVADSGDAAASNFTFDFSESVASAGAIYRITNFVPSDLLNESSQTSTNATPPLSFATGVTPLTTEHLLLLLLSGGSIANLATELGASGYAVATSNPSWTEHYDIARGAGGGSNHGMAGASAERSTASATGAFSISTVTNNTDGTSDYRGVLIAIGTPTSAAGTAALHQTDPTFFAPTASAGTAGTADLHETEPDFFAPTSRATENTVWSNETKPSTNWTNET